ncbi:TPA: aldo/keto reductase [Listeria monocytogenes]
MIINENYVLSNQVKIPKIGFGTWMIENDVVAKAVNEAIKLGYRHIDTAQGYGNEKGVGDGIRDSGISREEIFLTSKIEADIKDYKEAVKSIEDSLKQLDVEYIDMMIIHSPQPWSDYREDEPYFEENLAVWKALEEAYTNGKIRAIGVSNFLERDLDNLVKNGTIKPMVNQILTHISNTPFGLIEYCKKNNILIEAYSPIGHGELLKSKAVLDIADKYNVSIAQLGIRYCLQLGTLPLPKASNPIHMKNNMEIDFEISDEDMNTLKEISPIENYGEASLFPVYGGKMNSDGSLTAHDFKRIKKG